MSGGDLSANSLQGVSPPRPADPSLGVRETLDQTASGSLQQQQRMEPGPGHRWVGAWEPRGLEAALAPSGEWAGCLTSQQVGEGRDAVTSDRWQGLRRHTRHAHALRAQCDMAAPVAGRLAVTRGGRADGSRGNPHNPAGRQAGRWVTVWRQSGGSATREASSGCTGAAKVSGAAG